MYVFSFDLLRQGLTKALAGLTHKVILFPQLSKCYDYRRELSSLLPGSSFSEYFLWCQGLSLRPHLCQAHALAELYLQAFLILRSWFWILLSSQTVRNFLYSSG